MTIQGYFNDYKNKRQYNLTISKLGDSQNIYNICDYDDNQTWQGVDTICWSTDPIQLNVDYADTFTHTIVRSATINLVSNFDLYSLILANNTNDIRVSIDLTMDNGSIISNPINLFTGYVNPLVFNSPFAHTWEEVQIECSDLLSTAQYIKYPDLILNRLNEQDTFTTIINNIATALGLTVEYDGLDETIQAALTGTKISNHLWAGDSPDDFMSCFDVLEELGKYWSIWFVEYGDKLRCFNWHNEQRTSITIQKDDFTDTSTNLSNSDSYTQIKLSCDIDDADTIVEFGDDLISPYRHYVKYLEELVAEGGGTRALNLFTRLVLNDVTEDQSEEKHPSESYKYMNFCWVKESKLWDFGQNTYMNLVNNNATQQSILFWLLNHPGSGAFVSFGRTDKTSAADNGPINSVELKDYLVISVGGQDSMSQSTTKNLHENVICSFTGSSKQFTPADSDTTNYLIISGSILLNKLMALTGQTTHCKYQKNGGGEYDEVNGKLYLDSQNAFSTMYYRFAANAFFQQVDPSYLNKSIPRIGENEYGSYYTHKFFDGDAGSEWWAHSTGLSATFAPVTLYGDLKQNKWNETWKYEYSYFEGKGKRIDNTSKIPILKCQLKIGDKYCVERIDKANGAGWGEFEWLTLEECPIIENEQWNFFTIGIDPKLDDFIIGKEYDIQNTIWYYDDIDGKGTAIPIKYSDQLAGEVEFKIYGPMPTAWTKTDKSVHGWWFWKSTHWDNTDYPILEKLSSILLSDFKIELTSDKGHIMNNTENNDLVYASDMNDLYIEDHEDDVKIATMITSEEASDWQVEMVTSDSHVMNTDNSPFYGFPYDTGEVDEEQQPIIAYTKPEQLYVNDFYLEYCYPRQIVDTAIKIKNIDWILNPDKYMFNYSFLEGQYVPIKYDIDLKYDSISFSMKDMTAYEIPENI